MYGSVLVLLDYVVSGHNNRLSINALCTLSDIFTQYCLHNLASSHILLVIS